MNNRRIVGYVKSFSYTVTSNLLSLLISTLVVLIVPKVIGVEGYGYWQLYLFYSSYVGFLHFGWNDGIYLRYGGEEYSRLDKDLFFSQFWMLLIMQTAIAVCIFSVSSYFMGSSEKGFILSMTAVSLLIVNTRYMLLYILQGTNRIKEYAMSTILDRIIYCLFIVVLLAFAIKQFQLMILADLIGKFVSLGFAVYMCRDIVLRKVTSFHLTLGEAAENIGVGIKLMFANIASKLVIGTVRFGIERVWDISTFGKVSLTLSISNLMVTFISAIALVLFPILRRTSPERLPGIYTSLRTLLMTPLLGLLVSYYPLKNSLAMWLPKYRESIVFMALVFPIFIYEGKMSLLINTYLKTLRMEKSILLINVISVLLSLLTTGVFVVLLKDLTWSVITIVILLAFRSVVAETFLSRTLKIFPYKDIILEMAMTVIFIITAWYIGSWLGASLYGAAYCIYLFVKRDEIRTTYENVKKLAYG